LKAIEEDVMKLERYTTALDRSPKAEYSVEFEGISKFLAYFEDVAGLNDRQILARGLEIASRTFGRTGSLMIERTTSDGSDSYAIIALGVDPQSGHILGKPVALKPALRLVK
jgi:hypothetical protein